MEAIRPTKINEHSLDTFLTVPMIQKNKINIQSQSLLTESRLSFLLASVISTEEVMQTVAKRSHQVNRMLYIPDVPEMCSLIQ